VEYCRNCGTKLIEGHQFCAECGEPVKQNYANEKKQTQSVSSKPVQENMSSSDLPKQPIFKSKKSKIFAIVGVVVVALLAGGYYVVGEVTSPTKVAEHFIDALDQKDVKTVKKYINEGQYEVKANDKEIKAFLNYLHEHPRMITSIADGLLSDATALEEEKSSEEPSPFAALKEDGKKWVLFDSYKIKIQTFYIDVASESEKTDIYVNDVKKATIEDEEQIGPLLPGEYTVKAVINGEYGKVEADEKLNTEDFAEQTASLEFDWSNHYVYIYSNYDDAVLYVNDKSTKMEIGDLEEFGPVPLDGSLKIYAQRKFGDEEKKSNVVTLEENTTDAELFFKDEGGSLTETDKDYDSIGASTETEAIEEVILGHYHSISNDNFQSAYDFFSSSYKSKVTFDGWTKGLEQNINDTVTMLNITSVDDTTAKAYVEMTSYDEQEDGSTLVQEWGGTWNLVKESDGWKLEKAQLEKLASRTE